MFVPCRFLPVPRLGRALFHVVVLFAVLPLSTLGQSATGTIGGRILNPLTGDYVRNAQVSVKGTEQVAFTDSEGAYQFTNIPTGSVTLRVILPGFDEQERVVQVGVGQTVRENFELTSQSRYGGEGQAVKLSAFTVAATREMDARSVAINDRRYAGNIKDVVSADAFGDVSEGNLGEFIKLMPGVAILSAAGDASQIGLRGFAGTQTPITMDGNDLPSAASSATGASRGILLEQISMTNVSRVEVIKTPIPSMSAEFLGGSVNLVPKSSFDRSKPQVTVRGTLQFTTNDYTWNKTPGPGSPATRKLRPGYDLSVVYPVTKNFGFTVSSLLSDQFGRLLGPTGTWQFTAAAGATETNPYRQTVATRNDPRETKRQSYAASVDWKPIDSVTLTFGFRRSSYELFTAPDRFTLSTGTNPSSYGPDFTQGRAGAATGVHGQIWTGKIGATDQFTFASKYRRSGWTADFSGSIAKSDLDYPNIQNGYFRSAVTRLTVPSALRLQRFHDSDVPQIVELRNSANNALIDWKSLSNYTLVNVGADNRNATDDIKQGRAFLRRDFSLGRSRAAIQVGGSYSQRILDRIQWTPNWTFLGADGVAGTADDSAGQFVDPVNFGQNARFNTPRDIQWVDLHKLWDLYVAHPNYFSLVEPAALITKLRSSERILEEITAGYWQGELKLLDNRLSFVGGIRWEKTKDRGLGLLRDRNAIYQRDAQGNLLRNAAGAPILITSDPILQTRLSYLARGAAVSRVYDGYYPSLNGTYRILDNLQLRASYASTLGRPEFSNIIPNVDINENTTTGLGTVTARNPALKPWSAKNYEVSLEYYFKADGVFSVSVFRKDVTNAFRSSTTILDSATAAQLELDPQYVGFDLVSMINVPEVTRFNGLELNYQQRLTFLPQWASGFSVFGNGTILKTQGSTRIGLALQDKTFNWGVSYSRKRFKIGLKWNYIPGEIGSLTSIGANGVSENTAKTNIDMDSEFRFTPHFGVFFNARNLMNTTSGNFRYTPLTPDYSRVNSVSNGGAKLSAGVKATF